MTITAVLLKSLDNVAMLNGAPTKMFLPEKLAI